jgi:uncharacterized protein (DUF2252 family)
MAPPTREDRHAILEAKRTLKMARSTHAYVRGNTVKFYEWLEASPGAHRVPHGPAVWICGDCHLGNLGPINDGDGRIAIQVRDLDQAVIGNPAHDLIRLGLSLATAARGSDLPGVVTARMMEEMVDGYAAALRDPTDGDAGPEPDAVRSVRRRALGRRWRDLAKERFATSEPRIPIGTKFWPLDDAERAAIAEVVTSPEVADLVLSLDHKDRDREVRLVDAAYWMKGCSSLGLLRFAVLIGMKNAKGRSDYALIDLKEAIAPIAPAAPGAEMPADPAERVVAAARALAPHLGSRMIAARALDRSLFVRELSPQDLKLEIEQFSDGQAVKAARYLAFVVGAAHARQMDATTRGEWAAVLDADRKGEIDAPSWLWESVVSLAGSHEAGYLDHCRRYAMAAGALGRDLGAVPRKAAAGRGGRQPVEDGEQAFGRERRCEQPLGRHAALERLAERGVDGAGMQRDAQRVRPRARDLDRGGAHDLVERRFRRAIAVPAARAIVRYAADARRQAGDRRVSLARQQRREMA